MPLKCLRTGATPNNLVKFGVGVAPRVLGIKTSNKLGLLNSNGKTILLNTVIFSS